MPENPRRDRPPRHPPPGVVRGLLRSRPARKPAEMLQRGEQSDITGRPDVRSTQDHQQVYFSSPWPDTLDLHQLVPRRSNWRPGHPSKIQVTGGDPFRRFTAIRRLLAGYAKASQPRDAALEDGFRSNTAEFPVEPVVYGTSRHQGNLLLQNDLNQAANAGSARP